MEFLKKHSSTILCILIIVSVIMPFMSIVAKPVYGGSKEVIDTSKYIETLEMHKLIGYIIPASAIVIMVCNYIKKPLVSLVSAIVGFICLNIYPKSIFKIVCEDYKESNYQCISPSGNLSNLAVGRKIGFWIMFICFIILILKLVVELFFSSKSSGQSENNTNGET